MSEEIIYRWLVSPFIFPKFIKLSSISHDLFQAFKAKSKFWNKANKCFLAASSSVKFVAPLKLLKAFKNVCATPEYKFIFCVVGPDNKALIPISLYILATLSANLPTCIASAFFIATIFSTLPAAPSNSVVNLTNSE